MATGAETKINYQADYDFYLECLFKRTPWACSVIDYFNKEVFNTTSQPHVLASNNSPTISQPQMWEDDLLDELDAPSQTSSLSSLPATSSATVDVVSSYHASMSIDQEQSVSTSAQLQLDVSQLLLGNRSATHRALSCQPQVQATEPERAIHVTHHGGTRAVAPSRNIKENGKGKGRGSNDS
ncbi:hypothetical protein BDR04DRAFT_1149896 [Suillus decipiens]|nr:hypothetical protein BDR04DRAFT_1149896 [Suillus decipiens]